MRTSRINIKRDDTVLQVENWPTAGNITGITVKTELAVQSLSNVATINASVQVLPICQDGVCQLGEWKPNRNVA
jgi:hypothetical protein